MKKIRKKLPVTRTKSIDFTQNLLKWNRSSNKRAMPWKGEKDPYKIWLSEIILQQTRVEQGWIYYEKFIHAFPDVKKLATAPEKKIFKLWEGLGYYTRCRNLIETAKKIMKDYHGKFPDSYQEIRQLKGIGPYTAAAIASFAFKLPHAVLDGNVQRVLSRYFGITAPVDTTSGRKLYQSLAEALLYQKDPGKFNQAMMDFGATVCKPMQPKCSTCIQRKDCMAYQNGWVGKLPVKAKKLQKKIRWFCYLIIQTTDGKVYLRKRDQPDIWKNLYEFVLWESGKLLPHQQNALIQFVKKIAGKEKFKIEKISKIFTQELTHQTIHGQFVHILSERSFEGLKNYQLIPTKKIKQYPFPKLLKAYLASPVQQLIQLTK